MNNIAIEILITMFVASAIFIIAAVHKETQVIALGFGIVFLGIAGIIAAILSKK